MDSSLLKTNPVLGLERLVCKSDIASPVYCHPIQLVATMGQAMGRLYLSPPFSLSLSLSLYTYISHCLSLYLSLTLHGAKRAAAGTQNTCLLLKRKCAGDMSS